MKKFFGMHCKEEEDSLKKTLIHLSEVPQKFVTFVEIHVMDEEFIHVTVIDDQNYSNKKDLVLIHGLAGSALNFFKIFKRLSEDFKIYGIDLPGMGLSSRHYFHNDDDLHSTEDYFIEKLKLCFKGLNLEKFYMMAHSFGGYISSLYTMRYPSDIIQLFLLSPVGLSANYTEIASTRLEDFLQAVCFKIKKTPNFLLKIMIGSSLLFNYIADKSKFRGLHKDEEFIAHRDFINVVLRNKIGSEKAGFIFFNKNLQAYKPLTYYHELLKNTNIVVLYGKDDWCPKSHAEDLKYHLPENVTIDIVSDSGHFLYTDNYEELLDKFYKYLIKPDSQISSYTNESIHNESDIMDLNLK